MKVTESKLYTPEQLYFEVQAYKLKLQCAERKAWREKQKEGARAVHLS
jgi:hypothetical protein